MYGAERCKPEISQNDTEEFFFCAANKRFLPIHCTAYIKPDYFSVVLHVVPAKQKQVI
jgi:hypothetical protein